MQINVFGHYIASYHDVSICINSHKNVYSEIFSLQKLYTCPMFIVNAWLLIVPVKRTVSCEGVWNSGS